jgi:hypothetical protein
MDFSEKLNSYYKNIEELDKIHDEYEKALDSDNYLVKLSKTLADSCNQFIKFLDIMDDKELYLDSLIDFSLKSIDIYKSLPLETLLLKSVFKRKKKMKLSYQENKEKIDIVLDQMDVISNLIDKAVEKIK